MMKEFDDNIPDRDFDNFQVNNDARFNIIFIELVEIWRVISIRTDAVFFFVLVCQFHRNHVEECAFDPKRDGICSFGIDGNPFSV